MVEQQSTFQLELPQNSTTSVPEKKGMNMALKIFLILIGIFAFIFFGIPILLLLFCLIVGVLSGGFNAILPVTGIFLALSILAFLFISCKGTTKTHKNQLMNNLPYFGAILFFGVLLLGGYAHKDSSTCDLVNIQTMIIRPLLSYVGLMTSSILLYFRIKKE